MNVLVTRTQLIAERQILALRGYNPSNLRKWVIKYGLLILKSLTDERLEERLKPDNPVG